MKYKSSMTAAELMEKLRADPELVRRNRERERRSRERAAAFAENQASLVRDLTQAGYSVDSVYDLVNAAYSYPEAIPILLKHLGKAADYQPAIREGIARALTVPEAKHAVPQLIEAYRADPVTKVNGPKWALGNAIEVLADEHHVDEIVELALDPSYGPARDMLVYTLAKLDSPKAKQALEKLRQDPEMGSVVEDALGRRQPSR